MDDLELTDSIAPVSWMLGLKAHAIMPDASFFLTAPSNQNPSDQAKIS